MLNQLEESKLLPTIREDTSDGNHTLRVSLTLHLHYKLLSTYQKTRQFCKSSFFTIYLQTLKIQLRVCGRGVWDFDANLLVKSARALRTIRVIEWAIITYAVALCFSAVYVGASYENPITIKSSHQTVELIWRGFFHRASSVSKNEIACWCTRKDLFTLPFAKMDLNPFGF